MPTMDLKTGQKLFTPLLLAKSKVNKVKSSIYFNYCQEEEIYQPNGAKKSNELFEGFKFYEEKNYQNNIRKKLK